jgi:hypothetical protein
MFMEIAEASGFTQKKKKGSIPSKRVLKNRFSGT